MQTKEISLGKFLTLELGPETRPELADKFSALQHHAEWMTTTNARVPLGDFHFLLDDVNDFYRRYF
jgi:hypothetical protein